MYLQKEGELRDYLWKDRNKNIVYVVNSKKKAKEAILNYKVIKTINRKTLVQIQLKQVVHIRLECNSQIKTYPYTEIKNTAKI